MKKLSLLFLSALLSLSLFSQNFLSEGKQWNIKIEAFGVGGMQVGTEIFFIEGDSIVNSINYKKIWLSTDSLNSATLQGFLREESDKVYYLPTYGDEGLLYDFGLNVGDTAYIISLPSIGSELEIYITAIDTIEYEGVQRKRMQVEGEDFPPEYWIEGIGDVYGPLYTMIHQFWICPSWLLICAHENDELIYMEPYAESCYETSVGIDELSLVNISITPNPVKQGQAIKIEAFNSISNIQVYNIAGKLIKTTSPTFNNDQSINTHDLEKGLYLLKIEMADGEVLTSKVLLN